MSFTQIQVLVNPLAAASVLNFQHGTNMQKYDGTEHIPAVADVTTHSPIITLSTLFYTLLQICQVSKHCVFSKMLSPYTEGQEL